MISYAIAYIKLRSKEMAKSRQNIVKEKSVILNRLENLFEIWIPSSTNFVLLVFVFILSYRYLNQKKKPSNDGDSVVEQHIQKSQPAKMPARMLGFRAHSTLTEERPEEPDRSAKIVNQGTNDRVADPGKIPNDAGPRKNMIEVTFSKKVATEIALPGNPCLLNGTARDALEPSSPKPEANVSLGKVKLSKASHISPIPCVPSESNSVSSNITRLCLAGSRLDAVPPHLHEMISLRVLILRQNQLKIISSRLSVLIQLDVLDLGENQIHHIDDNFFQHMSSLHSLILADNQLTTLPTSLGLLEDSLKTLRLENNPFKFPFDVYSEPLIQALNETPVPEEVELLANNVQNSVIYSAPLGHGYLLRLLGLLKDMHQLVARQDEKSVRSSHGESTALNQPLTHYQLDPVNDTFISSKPDIEKRDLVIKELIETEKTYVSELELCHTLYIIPLQNEGFSHDEIRSLFGNWKMILDYHKTKVSPTLHQQISQNGNNVLIGEVFLSFHQFFALYSEYMNNHDQSTWMISQLQDTKPILNSKMSGLLPRRAISSSGSTLPLNSSMILRRAVIKKMASIVEKAKLDSRHSQINLGGYLLLPVQRLPRYQLLIEQCLKFTPQDHSDYNHLKVAISSLKNIIRRCNESKRVHELQTQVDRILANIGDPNDYLTSLRCSIGSFKGVYTTFSILKYVQPHTFRHRLASSPQKNTFDPLRFTNEKKHKLKEISLGYITEWIFHPFKESHQDHGNSVKAAREIEAGGAIALYNVPRLSGRLATLVLFDNALLWCTKSEFSQPLNRSPLRSSFPSGPLLPRDVNLVEIIDINNLHCESNAVSSVVEWLPVLSGPTAGQSSILRLCNRTSSIYIMGATTEIKSFGNCLKEIIK